MTDPNLISPFDEHGRFTGPLIETHTAPAPIMHGTRSPARLESALRALYQSGLLITVCFNDKSILWTHAMQAAAQVLEPPPAAPDLRPALKQALDTLHWALGADPAHAPGHHARFALDVAQLLEASK